MEEKDVTFNIVSGIPDDNGNVEIGITSDIDDDINYLDVNEKMCLIVELISQCSRQIISEKYPEEDVEEYDEDDKDQEEVRANLHKFLEHITYLIINTVHNLSRVKFGKGPQAVEFSMATYTSTLNIFGNMIHRTEETYHSPDVSAIDPMQASFDFFTDTIWCLLNDDIPKSEIKDLIDGAITSMRKDYINMIDEFKKE